MHQHITINCQNTKKGYLIQRTGNKPGDRINERQSFAQYVNQLSETQQQLLTHIKQTPRKDSQFNSHPNLPKLHSPDIMSRRFVLNVTKCPVNHYQSPIFRANGVHQQQHCFHPIQSPRHNSLEVRKSMIQQNKLTPIQKNSIINMSGRSVRDEDMSLFYYKIGGDEVVDQLNQEFYHFSSQHDMIKSIQLQINKLKFCIYFILIIYNLYQLQKYQIFYCKLIIFKTLKIMNNIKLILRYFQNILWGNQYFIILNNLKINIKIQDLKIMISTNLKIILLHAFQKLIKLNQNMYLNLVL